MLHMGIISVTNAHTEQVLKEAEIAPEDIANHVGAIGPVIPTERGDFKYGIKLTNADNNEPISDDDPRLIVR